MDYRENNGLIDKNTKKWERQWNTQFQSSITTLPGPSITIRNEQRPFTRAVIETVEKQRMARPASSECSRSVQTDKSSQLDDNVSISSSQSKFKNQIPEFYGGKFSRENLPKYNFSKHN